MKTLIFTIGMLAFSAMAVSAQDNAKAKAPADNPNAPELVFEEIIHDFGILNKGDDCTFDFHFKNAGKEPLILTNCQAACGCTTPACPKEPIAPGASSSIKVKYDSNRVGVFNKSITITSNAKNSPVVLSIKGKVEGPAQDDAFPGKNNGGMGQ